MNRRSYRARYGPTTGDLVRLADSRLVVRVETDDVGYGDEPLVGFGKTLRPRVRQRDRAGRGSDLDFLLVGVLLIDPLLGVRKTNLGIKDGRVVGVGRLDGEAYAGEDLVFGPTTCPLSGYGLIATPGGVDSHVHLPTPRLVPAALSAGVTTLITAGFEEPAYGMARMLAAFEPAPVNIGLQACARTTEPAGEEELVLAGAVGLKVHEDYGAYPELVDAALATAQAHDIAVSLHTDGLNETAEVDDTLAAIAGRTVHAYHVEGSAGGHPDNLLLVNDPAVICSSTTPSLPLGRWTGEDLRAGIFAVHGADRDVTADRDAVDERVRSATLAAEGPLQDLGAISIVNSDSQGVGRMAETLRRTWQLCDAMKQWRAGWGDEPADGHDNRRVLAYLAKYTVEPAIVHGIAGDVGSLAPGRLADVVLWRPCCFGVKPELVLKSGFEAWGALGDGNGSVERVQPVTYGPHWGATGAAGASLGVTFVSSAALDAGLAARIGTRRRLVAVSGTRGLRRGDLVANRFVPRIRLDPADGTVTLAGRPLAAEPVHRVPLNRTYLLS